MHRQWEMSLQSNVISYWLGANQESALNICKSLQIKYSKTHHKMSSIICCVTGLTAIYSALGRCSNSFVSEETENFSKSNSFSNAFHEFNILVWNWSNTMNILSALWLLMAWCFSTRASVATLQITHPCVSSCLWVNVFFVKMNAF